MVKSDDKKAFEHKELGIAVVGAGRIGTRRARSVANHPGVRFLAISDKEPARARDLAQKVNAQFHSGDNLEVISRPEVNAVIVSSSEHEHALPVIQALERGKTVLVEKPIALTLADADQMLDTAKKTGIELRVGYSKRFKNSFISAKEHISQGRLGKISGATMRVYNTRTQMFEILKRSPHATPIMDVLTYYADLACWYLEGNPPVEVISRGHGTIFRGAGADADDVTWAIVTFAGGAVVNLGVCYALPDKYPTFGQDARVEILGTEGVIIIDDDHRDQVLFTNRGIPHSYIPGQTVNMAFMNSSSPGEFALGEFWGPLADETRAWLDHLSTGHPCHNARAEEGRMALEVTLAIQQASRTGKIVKLPLEEE
jgi:predicted dehydrogenase